MRADATLLPGLSQAALRRHFEPRVLERARGVALAATAWQREGALLRVTAEARGSQVYRVQLLLQPGVSVRGLCDCAYAQLGRACKHQAALALAWRAQQGAAAEDAAAQIDALEAAQRPREALAACEAAARAFPNDPGIEARLLAAYERDGWDEQALRLRRAAFERSPDRARFLALARAAEAAARPLDALTLWQWLDAREEGPPRAAQTLQAWAERELAQARPPFSFEQALVRGALLRMEPPAARLWWAWLKLQARGRPALRQALGACAAEIDPALRGPRPLA